MMATSACLAPCDVSLMAPRVTLTVCSLLTTEPSRLVETCRAARQVGVLFGVVLLSWPLTQITEAILNGAWPYIQGQT